MTFELPKIYPITDTRISGISHAEQVVKLIVGGATLIQLREKEASPKEFLRGAIEVVTIAHRNHIRIIINDRVDVALAAGADGVHLGQDDLPPDEARAILGESAIIGFSTHSVDQAIEAMSMPIDYIAIGPAFKTKTKLDPDAVVGLDGIKNVRRSIGNFPLAAIGGINDKNLGLVFMAGADSAAMIAAIVSDAATIEQRMTDFLSCTN